MIKMQTQVEGEYIYWFRKLKAPLKQKIWVSSTSIIHVRTISNDIRTILITSIVESILKRIRSFFYALVIENVIASRKTQSISQT